MTMEGKGSRRGRRRAEGDAACDGWARLEEAYQEHGLTLLLGSGVSAGSGIPLWKDLVRRLVERLLPTEGQELFHHFEERRLALPVIASILEQHCRGENAEQRRSTFVEAVREALYEEFRFWRQDITKANRRQLVSLVKSDNWTLRTVAALCAVRAGGGRTFRCNPRIHAVVTQNLDALLQAYTYARYEQRLLRTTERPSAGRLPGRINVYHMHGFLRFDSAAGDPRKDGADRVILTEQDYYNFFNDPNSMFNYTVLFLLREHPSLSIGLSMQDENLRRLLHYSKQEKMQSYVEEEGEKNLDHVRHRVHRHFVVLMRGEVSEVDPYVESALTPLGVVPLWISRLEEIPKRLGRMYERAGNPWTSVF